MEVSIPTEPEKGWSLEWSLERSLQGNNLTGKDTGTTLIIVKGGVKKVKDKRDGIKGKDKS